MVNKQCIAHIQADPEIGGIGVMTSFLVIAWITLLLAFFPAKWDLTQALKRVRKRSKTFPSSKPRSHPNRQSRKAQQIESRPLFIKRIKSLLIPVCDLQTITGVALVIAGFTQIKTISYYHGQLVLNYWWLTMVSFWVARVDYMDESEKDDWVRLFVRRVTTVISCVLGVALQIVVIFREDRGWEAEKNCYRYPASSQSWFWIVGPSIYAIVLIAIMIPGTRGWVMKGLQASEDIEWRMFEWFRKSCVQVKEHAPKSTRPPNFDRRKRKLSGRKISNIFQATFSGLVLCVYWLLIQFLAITTYGDGFYPLLYLVYVSVEVWTTYDIIYMAIYNYHLLDHHEHFMGFGQVLPLVLIGVIGFQAVDVFRGDKMARRELDWEEKEKEAHSAQEDLESTGTSSSVMEQRSGS